MTRTWEEMLERRERMKALLDLCDAADSTAGMLRRLIAREEVALI